MKYKIGDRVFIKPWKLMEKEYGLDNKEWINGDCCFNSQMERELKGRNRIIVITRVVIGDELSYYKSKLDGELKAWGWNVIDNMIAGYAFDYDEEAEFSDSVKDKKCWHKDIFCAFAPEKDYPYVTKRSIFCYARPLKKEPEIEITVKINGKEGKLSDVSEETLRNIKEKEQK